MRKFKTFINILRNDPKKLKVAIARNFSNSKISHLMPDKAYLRYMYKANFGKKLNLKNPQTFNEKLQWLKLFDRKEEYVKIVDKFEVKEYISEKIGEEYIIPTIGVWNEFDEIDFDLLPDQFVLKCTHDSGSVVICRDKSKFDIDAAKKKLTKKLKSSLFWQAREWPYKNVKPRIIAEKYMEDNSTGELRDYKFYSFNGEPKLLYISQGLSNHETARISYLTLDWEKAPFKRNDFRDFDELPPKPANFELMIDFCRKLSNDIPFLRVDFYDINGKLYFGELTFFPGAGFTVLEPAEWDEKMGEWIKLPCKS